MEANRSKIIVRISKTGKNWVKGLKYILSVDGNEISEITNQNDKIEIPLTAGKHKIEVIKDNISHRQEVVLKENEMRIITINPSLSYKLGFGILVGIALAGMIISATILKKISPILLMIPLIPFIFFKKRHFQDDFALTT
jgi:hypothetical protein